jgi:parallel beta-helix repeat protein
MRTRAAIIALLLVSGPLAILAQCPVSSAIPIHAAGDIVSIESWSQATSPVYVTGNVTVREGGALNIKEGTEVLFDEGTHLNVEGGTLVVQGLPNMPVRFLPNSSSPWKGFYEWIYVNNTPMRNATVTIQWAEFSFGIKGLYLDGVRRARIDDVAFANTGEAGIYMSGCSDVGVRNCTFTASDGWGVRAEFSDNLTIARGAFSGCTLSSVELSDCVSSSVTASTVQAGSSDKGASLVRSSQVLIDGLVIEYAPVGMALERSDFNTVDSCFFSKNGVGLVLDSSADNLFRQNNFSACGMPLSFSGGPELARNYFQASNSVDGLPVRFINEGPLDGVPAGAVVLANCPASTVSNITFPPGGGWIIVLYGGGCVLRDIALFGASSGIAVLGSNGILIQNVTLSGSSHSGLTMWRTEGIGVRGCRFASCQIGMTFLGPMNMSMAGVALEGNGLDARLSEGAVVRFLDGSISSVETDATSRLDEDYTLRVSVRDKNGSGLAGVEMQVLHGGRQKYATPHFGGGGLLSGDSGDFPPVEVTAVTHAASNRTETNTDIEVWDGVNAFGQNPRARRLSAPTAEVFSATDPGFLAGTVRDPAGDPVADVNLTLDGGAFACTEPGACTGSSRLGPGPTP